MLYHGGRRVLRSFDEEETTDDRKGVLSLLKIESFAKLMMTCYTLFN